MPPVASAFSLPHPAPPPPASPPPPRLLLALVDGLLNNQLANPDPAFDPTTAIATVLPAILTAQPPP